MKNKDNIFQYPKVLDLATFGKVLSDPTRQRIMQYCCCRWVDISQIAKTFGLAQSTVSHHLAFLREAGLLISRKESRTTYYQLNQERVVNCCKNTEKVFAPDITEQG